MNFDNLVGHTFGQYELQDRLGAGGMGAVYRASQRSLKRLVAIKVLSPAIAEQPGYLERFNREAEVSAALEHKHIVPVYDYGVEQNTPYIVMRLLTGGSLAQRLQQAALAGRSLPTLYETSNLLKQLASALDYAHSRGVIHRDIKPGNVMFDNLGDAYLVDFGIAKLLDAMTDLTGTGGLGTPSYMPPEQWRSEDLTSAADQYALAVAVYNVLTGHLPFDAETPFQMMHKHLNEQPTPLRAHRDDLPPAVELVLDRALRKTPQERFPTVTAFSQAFDGAIAGAPAEITGFFDFRLAGTPTGGGGTAPPSRGTPSPGPGTPMPPPPTSGKPSPPPPRRGGVPWLPIVLGVVVLLVGLALVVPQIGQPGDVTPTRQALIVNAPATATHTPVPSVTFTLVATGTETNPANATTVSIAAVSTSTEIAVDTDVPTNTVASSATPTDPAEPSPTQTTTLTSTPSITPTDTATPSPTATTTWTSMPSATPTNTATLTPTPTSTATSTPIPTLTSTQVASLTPTATRTPLPTESPTPQTVAAAPESLDSAVTVAYEDNFESEEISPDWDVWNDEPRLVDGQLVFVGQDTWDNAIARPDIDPNEGVLVLFQFDDALRMEFNLQHGDYTTDSWRNWTFARWGAWEAAVYYGAEDANSEVYAFPYLETDTWYYLLFRIGDDGTFYTQVWERDNPAYYHVNVAAQPPETGWDEDDWEFAAHLYSGTLRLDTYQELSFPAKYVMPDTPPNLAGVPAASVSQATEAALSTQSAIERPDVLAFCDDPDGGEPPPSDLEAGQMIDVYWYWYATTPELLLEHIDNAVYEVTVDGQLLDEWLLYREPVFRIQDGDYYQYWSVPFGPLAKGEHQISVYVTWTAPISDGYSEYGPGSDTPEWSSSCTFSVQ